MVLARLRALVAVDVAERLSSEAEATPATTTSTSSTTSASSSVIYIRGGGGAHDLASALAVLFRWGACLGYGGLLLVFTLRPLRPASYKLSARLSVLMLLQVLLPPSLQVITPPPTSLHMCSALSVLLMLLQGLVLVGLAPLPTHPPPPPSSAQATAAAAADPLGAAKRGSRQGSQWHSLLRLRSFMASARDPLAALLALSPAAWGNVSYAQYVLQFVVSAARSKRGRLGGATIRPTRPPLACST